MEHAKAGYIVRLRFLRYHTSLWTGLLRIYRLDVQNRIGYQFICRNMESVGQYLCDIRIRTPPRGSWFYGGSRNCSRQPRSYLCGGGRKRRTDVGALCQRVVLNSPTYVTQFRRPANVDFDAAVPVLSGIGTRRGNAAVTEIAKRQVGNVGGRPYWSWYGFTSRVEWCACFVSWCYAQAGASEPRFSGCTSGGMGWFQSHGQWADRYYPDIAPGDAIFFDWDGTGDADHVGIVIGSDGKNVYTVEGNSGDACRYREYPLGSSVIRGYGLMVWD